MTPYEIRTGDALELLESMPSESVQCCVTSPPYWGLRDYGVPGQLGLEATPEEYVEKIVAVFEEVRRVLRGDGTLWMNLGDGYAANVSGHNPDPSAITKGGVPGHVPNAWGGKTQSPVKRPSWLKPKDLVGIPWRVAFALQAAGWWLRSDIIWAKPNPMPESVTDRPTKAHEYVFLLAKCERYFFDQEAVKEPAINAGKLVVLGEKSLSRGQANGAGIAPSGNGTADSVIVADGRNIRSVWSIATEAFPEAHFATFPTELAERCIKAGSKPRDTVLDPFAGAGTTGLVANRLGRAFIGLELNPTYAAMASRRIRDDAPLFNSGLAVGVV